MSKKYIIFGSDITSAFEENDWDEIERIVNNGDYGIREVEFPIKSPQELANILNEFEGWNNWNYISEEEYNKINEILTNYE